MSLKVTPKSTVKMKEKPKFFGDADDRYRPSRGVSFKSSLEDFQPRNTNLNEDYFKVENNGEP